MEALGAGLAIQAALDPAHVRMSLQTEVVAKLLGLPLPPGLQPAEELAPDN